MRALTAVAVGVSLMPSVVAAQQPRDHVLEGGPTTVAWGYYWSEAPPVLRIESGDIVDMSTFLTSSPTRLESAGIPPDEGEPALRAVYDQVTERGPPAGTSSPDLSNVEGAEPGDVLEVRILSVEMPLAYGYNGCSGCIRDLCEGVGTRIVRRDRDRNTAEFLPGVTVPLAPFFGSMGVAPPPDADRWSSVPPWIHAGNIDNKDMVAGTTLFIPAHVAGALPPAIGSRAPARQSCASRRRRTGEFSCISPPTTTSEVDLV